MSKVKDWIKENQGKHFCHYDWVESLRKFPYWSRPTRDLEWGPCDERRYDEDQTSDHRDPR